jgi:hypothetical protein
VAKHPELVPMIVLSLLAGTAQAAAPGAVAPADPELLEFLGGSAPRPNGARAPDPVELLEQIDLPAPKRPPEKRGAGPNGEPRS